MPTVTFHKISNGLLGVLRGNKWYVFNIFTIIYH